MTPDSPGIWLFRHNGVAHTAGHVERIPVVWRQLEDLDWVLEPYGMAMPGMVLDDFRGCGEWEGRAGALPPELAHLGLQEE